MKKKEIKKYIQRKKEEQANQVINKLSGVFAEMCEESGQEGKARVVNSNGIECKECNKKLAENFRQLGRNAELRLKILELEEYIKELENWKANKIKNGKI